MGLSLLLSEVIFFRNKYILFAKVVKKYVVSRNIIVLYYAEIYEFIKVFSTQNFSNLSAKFSGNKNLPVQKKKK